MSEFEQTYALQQYKITDAYITADRFNDLQIDVTNRIYELSLYESLDKPYITGNVVIVDDIALFEDIDFKGTERLTVTISPPVEGNEEINDFFIRKTFIISQIVKSAKPNDNTETIIAHLEEEHYYYNTLRPISRAYTGSFNTIVSSLVSGELGKRVDDTYLSTNFTSQGVHKVLIPYMTPLEACNWILKKATTKNGSPLFLYSSVFDESLRLGDLDLMLSKTEFNKNLPFYYSQAATQTAVDLQEAERATQISAISEQNMENTIDQIDMGGIGSFYSNTDIGTGVTYRRHISAQEIYNNFKNNSIVDQRDKQLFFDDRQTFDDKFIHEFNSVYFHQISSSNTYGDYKSYHDTVTQDGLSLTLKSQAIRIALEKNMFNIIIPGTTFMVSKASVGDIINLKFLKSHPLAMETEDFEDSRKSGNYIIYQARHTFRDTRHDISLNVTRLNRKDIEQ